MLIALLISMMLGGGDGFSLGILSRAGLEQLGEQIEVTVVDAERRDAALNAIETLDELIEQSEETNSDSLKTLRKLYKDHSSESEQLLAAVENVAVDWESLQNSELDARFGINLSLTEEEWTQVFAVK